MTGEYLTITDGVDQALNGISNQRPNLALPRAVLIIITTLFIPAEDDVLSLDAVIDGRVRRVFGS